MARTIEVPVDSVLREVSVNVELTGKRKLTARLTVAMPLILLAAWIGGFKGVSLDWSKDE